MFPGDPLSDHTSGRPSVRKPCPDVEASLINARKGPPPPPPFLKNQVSQTDAHAHKERKKLPGAPLRAIARGEFNRCPAVRPVVSWANSGRIPSAPAFSFVQSRVGTAEWGSGKGPSALPCPGSGKLGCLVSRRAADRAVAVSLPPSLSLYRPCFLPR